MTIRNRTGKEKNSRGGQRRLWKKAGAARLLPCLLLLVVLAFTVPLLTGCSRLGSSQKEYTLNSFFFDTVIAIRFHAEGDGDALVEGCRAMCEDIEHTFSRTDQTSELYAVNHRTQNKVEVSSELAALVQEGLTYYEISQGMLDITVAPLSDLWDFKSEDPKVPEKEDIAKALRRVDARRVQVLAPGEEAGEDAWYLVFDDDATMIDLGALVKGYAADRLADYLERQGVVSGLINLGGNVKAIGKKPDGSAWKVGIRKPFSEDLLERVDAADLSVVTSGVYERCFEQDGVLYHHILDPHTGYPVDNGLWSVTILCASSLRADALSTTCLALGPERAPELIRSLKGVEAVFSDSEDHVFRVQGADGKA